MTPSKLQTEVDKIPYWYHRIELPGGVVTPGLCPHIPELYRIPDDLTGKTVLDVGAWDGYWTFEALKRGARFVVAIDDFSDTVGTPVNADRSTKFQGLELCAKALGYGNRYRTAEMSVYDVVLEFNAAFDVVFCFGLLYHLKHPLLALEKLRTVCKGSIHIETAILDSCQSVYSENAYGSGDCCMEFYPGSEYGRNASNWWVPTLRCAANMLTVAGFRDIKAWKLDRVPQSLGECRGYLSGVV